MEARRRILTRQGNKTWEVMKKDKKRKLGLERKRISRKENRRETRGVETEGGKRKKRIANRIERST
jgi:hypothetical protein